MPYRFVDGERADQAIRRIATEQLDQAITELTDGLKADPVEAVHSARKALKKDRSLLRLARGSMKPSARQRENAAFRSAGRRLSGARDADVMVEALDELAKRYSGQLPERTYAVIREHLHASGQQSRRTLMDSALTGEVAQELKAARVRTEQWQLRRGGWKAVETGLLTSYTRGRRAFRRARKEPTVERLHDWRKRAKDHWYHLRLLEPIAPQTMKGQAKEAHRLADLLGDDHDLAVLRQTLFDAGAALPVDLDGVIALLDHRRGRLQAQAMFEGDRVYAEKPKEFVSRLHAYWKTWRAETRAGRAHHPARLAKLTRHRVAR